MGRNSKPNGKPTKWKTYIALLVGSRGGVLQKQLLTNVSGGGQGSVVIVIVEIFVVILIDNIDRLIV